MAWLRTPVRLPEDPRLGRRRGGRSAGRGESRLERYRREGVDRPPMPPVDVGGHLIGYLLDVGPTCSNGMDQGPISYQEIDAWARLSGIPLQPWEAGLLRRLSRDYVAETHRAADPKAPPPWFAPTAIDRKVISQKVRSIFGALAHKGKQQ